MDTGVDNLVGFSGGCGWPNSKVAFAELRLLGYYTCAGSDLGNIPGEGNLASETVRAVRPLQGEGL